MASWGWENNVLQVEYRSGGTYDYFDVPEATWAAAQNATSAGKFIDSFIKGIHNYQKV